MMEKYLNKEVRLCVKIDNERLYYTGIVTEISKDHISFIDKYYTHYTYKKILIEEISCT